MQEQMMQNKQNPEVSHEFSVYARLAVGGMAELFLAKQQQTDGSSRDVVLKRIHFHLSNDSELVTMLLDEANATRCLEHPNVVKLYDVVQLDIFYCLVMEYVRGKDVTQIRDKLYCREKLYPNHYEMMAEIILQITEGLDYIHNAVSESGELLGIIHRDISPTNLLLGYDGVLKLIDFGLAKTEFQEHKTAAGMVKGKYSYMSPEQIQGGALDSRSDLFSLGIVMFELMTNMDLFERENNLDTMKAVALEDIPRPTSFIPDFPRDLEAIILKALERDLNARYQSADEIRFELKQFLARRKGYELGRLGEFVEMAFEGENPNLHSLSEGWTPTKRSNAIPTPAEPVAERSSRKNLVASTQKKAPFQTKNTQRMAGIFVFVLILFLGVGVFWLFRGPSAQPFSFVEETEKVKKLIVNKKYSEAAVVLDQMGPRTKTIGEREWVQQMQQVVKVSPRLELARNMMKDKEYSAALYVLKNLEKKHGSLEQVKRLRDEILAAKEAVGRRETPKKGAKRPHSRR